MAFDEYSLFFLATDKRRCAPVTSIDTSVRPGQLASQECPIKSKNSEQFKASSQTGLVVIRSEWMDEWMDG